MKLKFNKTQFVDNILSPVSKISDNLLLDFNQISENTWIAKTIVNSADKSVILLGEVECNITETPFSCIIPNCTTFLRLFGGIDAEEVSLVVDSNVIKYNSSTVSFKYHLLDESYIISKKSISEEKLKSLSFDTTFVITKQKFSEIIKFNSIVPDAEKLYFCTDNKSILAKIGDELKTNTNEIVTQVSSSFEGKHLPENFPINILNILLFCFNSQEITVSVNHQLKIFKFATPSLSYIVSGLVK